MKHFYIEILGVLFQAHMNKTGQYEKLGVLFQAHMNKTGQY